MSIVTRSFNETEYQLIKLGIPVPQSVHNSLKRRSVSVIRRKFLRMPLKN